MSALKGVDKARARIIFEMNIVAGIFLRSFNIDLSLISVDLNEQCDSGDSYNVPCKNYPGMDIILNRFSKWRDGQSDEAGIYHLVRLGC